MKAAWFVLLISAFTDFIITVATSLTAAMVATGTAQMPDKAVVFLAILGGLTSAGRTIQQALKSTTENSALLKGDQTVVSTTVIAKTDTKPEE